MIWTYHSFRVCLFPRDVLIPTPQLRSIRRRILPSAPRLASTYIATADNFGPLQAVLSPSLCPSPIIADQLSNNRARLARIPPERSRAERWKAEVAGGKVSLLELICSVWFEIKGFVRAGNVNLR